MQEAWRRASLRTTSTTSFRSSFFSLCLEAAPVGRHSRSKHIQRLSIAAVRGPAVHRTKRPKTLAQNAASEGTARAFEQVSYVLDSLVTLPSLSTTPSWPVSPRPMV